MRCSLLLACIQFFPFVWSSFGYIKQANGKTKLVGSSFGVLGINATFDYVVRLYVPIVQSLNGWADGDLSRLLEVEPLDSR